MPDSAELPLLTFSPGWLDLGIPRPIEQAKDRALASGQDASGIAEAAYLTALAHHPALLTSMPVEAVAAALATGSLAKERLDV